MRQGCNIADNTVCMGSSPSQTSYLTACILFWLIKELTRLAEDEVLYHYFFKGSFGGHLPQWPKGIMELDLHC